MTVRGRGTRHPMYAQCLPKCGVLPFSRICVPSFHVAVVELIRPARELLRQILFVIPRVIASEVQRRRYWPNFHAHTEFAYEDSQDYHHGHLPVSDPTTSTMMSAMTTAATHSITHSAALAGVRASVSCNQFTYAFFVMVQLA